MEVRFGKEKFDFDRVGCGLFCGNSEIVCNNAISDMLCQVILRKHRGENRWKISQQMN